MHVYAIALGSNRRHDRHGSPRHVLLAAIGALSAHGTITAQSPIIATSALGPAGRGFANAALLMETLLDPPALLHHLKRIERAFGRRRGRRWGARVLDLDILLWSGGAWTGRAPALLIPHPHLARRRFVLDPLVTIARDWRIPATALHVRHAHARLTRRVPLHRDAGGSGL